MTVSIREKGNRWHIRFLKGSGKNRREVIKSYPRRMHEKKIRQLAAHMEIEWQMGRFDPFEEKQKNNNPLLGEAITEYCEENLSSGNWSEKYTYKTNKNVFKRMFSKGWNLQLGDRTDELFFQSCLANSAGNARTKKGNAGRVNTFLKWAHEKEYLPERYKVEISMHEKIELRNRIREKHITWQQLRDVCAAHRWLSRQNHLIYGTHTRKPDDFYPDLWWFMFYSLLREQEVPKLTAGDLLTGGRLRVQGKGRRTDIIQLTPPALSIAEKYAYGKKKEEPLFFTNTNRARKHLGVAVELALGPEYCERHGAKGFHQLRHGGVVHYISLGKPIAFISKLARHRSISITEAEYADVIQDKMIEVFADVTHSPATSQRRELTRQNTPGLN